jgi:hypothetical protein
MANFYHVRNIPNHPVDEEYEIIKKNTLVMDIKK